MFDKGLSDEKGSQCYFQFLYLYYNDEFQNKMHSHTLSQQNTFTKNYKYFKIAT